MDSETTKAIDVDAYLLATSIAAANSMISIELSIGILFIIGTDGVPVVGTIAGACVSISVSA